MHNVEVPKPDLVFANMTHDEILEFGENSADYITVVDHDNILVLNLFPECLIVYEIYCTFDKIPENIITDLRNYGYKIIYSDKKLTDKFETLSDTLRAARIDLLFDKEFTHYAYP